MWEAIRSLRAQPLIDDPQAVSGLVGGQCICGNADSVVAINSTTPGAIGVENLDPWLNSQTTGVMYGEQCSYGVGAIKMMV